MNIKKKKDFIFTFINNFHVAMGIRFLSSILFKWLCNIACFLLVSVLFAIY